MRLARPLDALVRALAGADDAESMLADLECELGEREQRDGAIAARRWLRREIVRSTPVLLARRLALGAHALEKGLSMAHRGLLMDVQHVLRRLRRTPGFAALAIAMLGIGIGAATSVFTLAYAIWLKPLPYNDPATLVSVVNIQTRTGFRAGSSDAELADIRAGVPSFLRAAAYQYTGIVARFDNEPVRLVGYRVSVNLFDVLGVTPQLGRILEPDDVGQPLAVVSDTLWRSRFHRDPHAIGQRIGTGDEQTTIVGVMPRDFHFPLQLEADFWAPRLHATDDRAARLTDIVTRLAPGATIERASAELTTLAARLAESYPASNAGWTMRAEPLAGTPSPAYRAAFTTLLAMVGLFLVIACANLASLVAARNLARRNELTVALAMGASRWRLARALLLESAILSLLGGATALAITTEAIRAFTHWMPLSTPRLGDLRVDGVALMFAIAVAACTAGLCAIAPIAGVRSLRLSECLLGARAVGPTSNRGQHALVVIEIALATVLLMGGGVMVRSFNNLLDRDRGYVPSGVATMTVSVPYDDRRYEAAPVRADAFARILASVAQVHGATVVGAATGFPGSSFGILGGGPVTVPSRTDPPVVAGLHNATPDYFRAMGVTLKRGRVFTADDRTDTPRIVVINETLDRQLWPDGNSLGQHFRIPAPVGMPEFRNVEAEVVGVVSDMHLGARHSPDIFLPFAQVPTFWADVVVRTTGDPDALSATIRQTIQRAEPGVLIEHVSSLQGVISNAYGLERAQSFLTALVATLGGIIALTGVYALLNQYVARRRREMGICLALGSSPRQLFWSVFRRGMQLAAIGTALGLGGALLAARVLRGEVFGLDVAGVWSFLPVAFSVIVASAMVIATSARRVVGIDPLLSIRQV